MGKGTFYFLRFPIGIFEAGDQGLAGATVMLLQGSTEIATQVTGSDGSYVFGNLAAGSYTVQLPASSLGNRTATTAASFNVTLVQDQQNGDVDFGVTPTPTDPQNNASIGDLVFEDLDGDGAFDTGESGLAGINLALFQGSTEIATQTTASDGSYLFDNLAVGSYRVELLTDSLSLGKGTFYFLRFPIGIFEAGDQGLAGATVMLLQGSTEIATQVTGSDGSYVFGNLAAGTYTVQLPASSLGSRTATTATSFSVTLVQDQQNADADFGVTPTPTDPQNNASIGDLVFEDLDGNGGFDTGEPGLAGINLALFQGSTEIATQTTASDGSYLFDNLAAGSYRVELLTDSLGEREVTTASAFDVMLAQDENNDDIDFGVATQDEVPFEPEFDDIRGEFTKQYTASEFVAVAASLSDSLPVVTESFTIVDTGSKTGIPIGRGTWIRRHPGRVETAIIGGVSRLSDRRADRGQLR